MAHPDLTHRRLALPVSRPEAESLTVSSTPRARVSATLLPVPIADDARAMTVHTAAHTGLRALLRLDRRPPEEGDPRERSESLVPRREPGSAWTFAARKESTS